VSVLVQFDQYGRMGTRMFQYAFGSLLAKDRNAVLHSAGLPNFNIQDTPNYSEDLLKDTKIVNTKSYGSYYTNYNELVNLPSDYNIIVNSCVQKANYFISRRKEVQELFNLKQTSVINKDKLVVHIRETDYKQVNTNRLGENGVFLGYNVYKKSIEKTGYSDVIIITDNSRSETVQRLVSDGCVVSTEGCVNTFSHSNDDRGWTDFLTLLNSENILLSQSTFSWWPAFLGEHKNIYFPLTNTKGYWWYVSPGHDDIDLYFDYGNSTSIIF